MREHVQVTLCYTDEASFGPPDRSLLKYAPSQHSRCLKVVSRFAPQFSTDTNDTGLPSTTFERALNVQDKLCDLKISQHVKHLPFLRFLLFPIILFCVLRLFLTSFTPLRGRFIAPLAPSFALAPQVTSHPDRPQSICSMPVWIRTF